MALSLPNTKQGRCGDRGNDNSSSSNGTGSLSPGCMSGVALVMSFSYMQLYCGSRARGASWSQPGVMRGTVKPLRA